MWMEECSRAAVQNESAEIAASLPAFGCCEQGCSFGRIVKQPKGSIIACRILVLGDHLSIQTDLNLQSLNRELQVIPVL